jgi:hypothetical protein
LEFTIITIKFEKLNLKAMINKEETIAELKSKKLIGTRNKDSDYFLGGKKRYGINIENECGDVLDYEYFNSEKEALEVINDLKN